MTTMLHFYAVITQKDDGGIMHLVQHLVQSLSVILSILLYVSVSINCRDVHKVIVP